MEGLTNIGGTSYEMIIKWLCDQKSPFDILPNRKSEDGITLTLDRVLRVAATEKAFTEKFGPPIKVTPEGNVYRAAYRLNSSEELKKIDGALKILNGKVIEDTYISYIAGNP